MALIITATDFSDVATNAVKYACQLAAEINAEVEILHSYSVPLMFSDVPMPASFINDAQKDSDEHVSRLATEMSSTFPGLVVTGRVVFGDIVDAVDNYEEEEGRKPWMIVIGNSMTAESSSWPDSTLVDAFHNVKYPVLAVPPGVAYRPLKNICFAFDNQHNGNVAAVLSLAEIAENLQAQLTVLNVYTDPSEQLEIDATVRNLLAGLHPKYHIEENGNVDQAIESFIDNNDVDLLAMIPRKHSFFEGIFHRSHTKAVAHRSHIPILALHDSRK